MQVCNHVAKDGGIPLFTALWTAMTSHYIRGQALTLTKAHDERLGPLLGIAQSLRKYGYPDPPVAYTDDPKKASGLILQLFAYLIFFLCLGQRSPPRSLPIPGPTPHSHGISTRP